MEVDERSDQKSGMWPHWMAALVRLKNEFTEDEKYYNLNLMSSPKWEKNTNTTDGIKYNTTHADK